MRKASDHEYKYKVDGKVFKYLNDAIKHRKSIVQGREDMVVTIYRLENGYGMEPEWIPFR